MPIEVIAFLAGWSYIAAGLSIWVCCLDLHDHAGRALPRFVFLWLPALLSERVRRWVAR